MNKKQLTYKIINIESGWKITESFKVSSLLTRLENDKTQKKKGENQAHRKTHQVLEGSN